MTLLMSIRQGAYHFFIYLCQLLYHCQNNSKKTVFYVNSGNFPEFFKIFQKDIIIMQSGPFYNI